jgi:hypothetical protein
MGDAQKKLQDLSDDFQNLQTGKKLQDPRNILLMAG